MTHLTPKDRDLIQLAIKQFGTPRYQAMWDRWSLNHPQTPERQDFPQLPPEVAKMVLDVLITSNAWVMAQMTSGGRSEAEVVEMDNNLTVTEAIAEDIADELGMRMSG